MSLLRDLKNRCTFLLTTIFYKWRWIIDVQPMGRANYNVSSIDDIAEFLNQSLYEVWLLNNETDAATEEVRMRQTPATDNCLA